MASTNGLDLSGLELDDIEYGNEQLAGVESIASVSSISVTDGPTSGRTCCSGGGTSGFCKPLGGGLYSIGH